MKRVFALWPHWLAIILFVLASLLSPLFNRVEASTSSSQPEPTISAIGPTPPVALCYAWRERTGRVTFYGGFSGVPYVYADYSLRYNGCDVVKNWVNCWAYTTLVSLRFDWCGFYQPASWNKDKIEVGANWTECATPVYGVLPCWGGNYVRAVYNRAGAAVSCRPAPGSISGRCLAG